MHRMSPIFFKRTQFHRKNNIHDRTECFMIISKYENLLQIVHVMCWQGLFVDMYNRKILVSQIQLNEQRQRKCRYFIN